MDQTSLMIIIQRSWMDRDDRGAGYHLPHLQGRERRVQLPENDEIVEYRLDHGVDQVVRLITRCDEHSPRADCWNITGIAGVHAAGDDRSVVIGMRCE